MVELSLEEMGAGEAQMDGLLRGLPALCQVEWTVNIGFIIIRIYLICLLGHSNIRIFIGHTTARPSVEGRRGRGRRTPRPKTSGDSRSTPWQEGDSKLLVPIISSDGSES